MKYNIFDRRRRSVYSTNNSTLPLVIKWQSRIKLLKIVNPTFSVYIIVLCPENASKHIVTCLNWIPGTDKMDTYWTLARFPVFESVLYQEQTFTDKRQSTRNRWQNRFLPLEIPSLFGEHRNKVGLSKKSICSCLEKALMICQKGCVIPDPQLGARMCNPEPAGPHL